MHGPTTAISAGSLADAGLDPQLLDCWETTLALGLLAEGFADLASLLGSQWWFTSPAGAGQPPNLDREPQAERLCRLTGLLTVRHELDERGLVAQCEEQLASGRLPLVVTDAYLLPWCPYFGNKHVEHSFAVTAVTGSGAVDGATAASPVLAVADGYYNRTEWGTAVPLDTSADAATVAAVEKDPGTRIVVLVPGDPAGPPDRSALLRESLAGLAGWRQEDPYREFVRLHCEQEVDAATFEAFCEACWTIERRRALYASWLDGLAAEPDSPLPEGLPQRFREEVVAAWSAVNRFSYLALRRMRAGRGPARGMADLLSAASAAERALAAELTAPGGPE